MAQVQEVQSLNVSVAQAWALIGGFNSLPEWHPAVKGSVLEHGGRVRSLRLANGATLVERLQAFSESDHSYGYSIEEGPLPVANYRSQLSVREEQGTETCQVEWSGEFQPAGVSEEEAITLVRGIYRAGLDQLKEHFAR
jgi:hypothetical protein